ncbi:MAG: hypothetical protein P8Y97_21910 [Candidatus Lokiarchaeota archaeon]
MVKNTLYIFNAIWKLAELCVTINKNIENGYDIKPLETDNLVLLLRDHIDGKLIMPEEEEIRKEAEIIYNEQPERSKLNFYIAEKTLLLEEVKKVIDRNNQRSR